METWTQIIIPILTLVAGWFGNAYRNKQKREADIIDNVQDIIKEQREYIERQQVTVERVEAKLERIGVKIDAKKRAIREAYKCEYYKKGNDCPVLIEDDKNEEERMRVACAECPHNDEQIND